MHIKHSVVILCYNQEKSIERTLRSIISQTENPYEILILDDCSTDGTVGCVKNFIKDKNLEYPIRIHANTINLGIPKNAVKAGKLVRGNVISSVAGDDSLAPNAIEKMNQEILKNGFSPDDDYFISITNVDILNGELKKRVVKSRYLGGSLFTAAIKKSATFVKIGFSVNAYRYGQYPENIGHWADWFWDVSICSHKKIKAYRVEEPLYQYSVGVGITSKTKEVTLRQSYLECAELILFTFSNRLRLLDKFFLLGEVCYLKGLLNDDWKSKSLGFLLALLNVCLSSDSVISKSLIARYLPKPIIRAIRDIRG